MSEQRWIAVVDPDLMALLVQASFTAKVGQRYRRDLALLQRYQTPSALAEETPTERTAP